MPKVSFKLSASQLLEMRSWSRETGLSLSEVVRRRLFAAQYPPLLATMDREAWARLGPLAANLNLILRAAARGEAPELPRELLAEVRELLVELRRQLLQGRHGDSAAK